MMFSARFKTFLLDLLASPFVLAIPIAVGIILSLPVTFSKYEVKKVTNKDYSRLHSNLVFMDLNKDGASECLVGFNNDINHKAAVKITSNEGVNYDQWNFNGYFQNRSKQFICADLNKDGYPEVYVFYYRHDSVFLGAFQPYPAKRYLFKDRFITKVWKRNGEIDYLIPKIRAVDMDRDGYKDLVFSFVAGYSLQPRCIFIFNRKKDTLLRSKSTGIDLGNIVVADMDNDSFPEIYCSSGTPGNISDTLPIPYDDYDSWFTAYNHKLQFLFPPIENKGYPSYVNIKPFVNDKGEKFIVAFLGNKTKKLLKIRFYKNGTRLFSEKDFPFSPGERFSTENTFGTYRIQGKPYILIYKDGNYLVFINEKLKIKKLKTDYDIGNFILSASLLGKSHKKEYVFLTKGFRNIVITDDHFDHVVRIPVENKGFAFDLQVFDCGVSKNKTGKRELYVRYKTRLYYYTYRFNPLYCLKFPFWLLIYGVVVFILWFAQRMHRNRLLRNRQMEETITALQMKTLKSQLDPHFMFNILNGIANNVALGNKDETYGQIVRFSRLLRGLLRKTETLNTTLKEELDFVKDYLELEKFRFKEDFGYSISIDNHVNLDQKIPQMLIQLLVENAIKHGLRNKTGLKKVDVRLYMESGNTVIEVADNGIGREAAAKLQKPGKGLKLLRDLIRLHRKTGGRGISLQYVDLRDKNGHPSGTLVRVVLDKKS
ncbi:histidine kinase [Candidatus Sulfidibacterium hydrothermale]|uniref:histidine kinase n=1 Tax=Candidatus Sulfidibacterium hydrothermale TaxID=2875962 RepID=UPI001F0A04A1|nr:histidine kinase [Candidatus Sulfidibacterium hydrothermale]UBM62109.1 histidine kinase [Candidatus Sulfidibacterium hydrothermale]